MYDSVIVADRAEVVLAWPVRAFDLLPKLLYLVQDRTYFVDSTNAYYKFFDIECCKKSVRVYRYIQKLLNHTDRNEWDSFFLFGQGRGRIKRSGCLQCT